MKKLPLIYKRTSTGAKQQWQIIVDKNTFYTIEGLVNGKLTQSKPTICLTKNVGKANATTAEEQAFKQATAKRKKKLERGYAEDINLIDQVKANMTDQCMLAENYKNHKDGLKFPIYSDKKFNGMRCKIVKDGMWTRNDKSIISCPHIYESLEHLFDKNPDLFLDGELYNDDMGHYLNQILSLCRKQKPTQVHIKESRELIKYYIYDGYNIDGLGKGETFTKRKSAIKKAIKDLPFIEYVETDLASDQKELDQYYTQYIKDGYEGQMIRFDIGYVNKRTKFLLKRKEFTDSEYTIIEVQEGLGNKSGMAGNIICQHPDGRTFSSNIKGPHAFLKKLLKDKNKLVGKLATVQYFELTEYGIPQFPYVIQIDRPDK